MAVPEAESFYLVLNWYVVAYMEKERRKNEEMSYPSPIQPDKASTDRDL
jgi:proline dehydrogenase